MKKFIIFSLLCGWMLTSYSQEIIQLEETEVNFVPSAEVVFEDMNNGKMIVKESYAKQFESNAIKFVIDNFNIEKFLEANKREHFNEIVVRVQSDNGYLKATYDRKGNLERTQQQFKDILLPRELIEKMYVENPGWVMSTNKYMARSRGTKLIDEKYVIKLENGKDSKKIKFDQPYLRTNSGMAYVENK